MKIEDLVAQYQADVAASTRHPFGNNLPQLLVIEPNGDSAFITASRTESYLRDMDSEGVTELLHKDQQAAAIILDGRGGYMVAPTVDRRVHTLASIRAIRTYTTLHTKLALHAALGESDAARALVDVGYSYPHDNGAMEQKLVGEFARVNRELGGNWTVAKFITFCHTLHFNHSEQVRSSTSVSNMSLSLWK